MKQRVVVIGNGMVGQRFLEQLREAIGRVRGHRVLRGAAPGLRPRALTSFFSGKTADDLSLAPTSFFKETRATLRLNDAVLVDRRAEEGRALGALQGGAVRQAGARHRLVPVRAAGRRAATGATASSTAPSRTSRRSPRRAARSKVGVVIGGGLLGLEAAKALKDLGLETHVVEFAPRLMAVQLDDAAGRLLRRKIEALGVTVHLPKKHEGDRRRAGTTRHRWCSPTAPPRDRRRSCSRPASARATSWRAPAGLAVGERGGIGIDSHCRTTNPDIYAIGECALWQGRIFGLVAPGYQMAEVAARAHRRRDARAVPRRRHEHQAQADGRGRGLDRRRARQHARTR